MQQYLGEVYRNPRESRQYLRESNLFRARVLGRMHSGGLPAIYPLAGLWGFLVFFRWSPRHPLVVVVGRRCGRGLHGRHGHRVTVDHPST